MPFGAPSTSSFGDGVVDGSNRPGAAIRLSDLAMMTPREHEPKVAGQPECMLGGIPTEIRYSAKIKTSGTP